MYTLYKTTKHEREAVLQLKMAVLFTEI